MFTLLISFISLSFSAADNIIEYNFVAGQVSAYSYAISSVDDIEIETKTYRSQKYGTTDYQHTVYAPIVIQTENEELNTYVRFYFNLHSSFTSDIIEATKRRMQNLLDSFEDPNVKEIIITYDPEENLVDIYFKKKSIFKRWFGS